MSHLTDQQIAVLEAHGFDGDYIAQYGIKGMKWGVRRDQRTLDRLAGRIPRGSSDRGGLLRKKPKKEPKASSGEVNETTPENLLARRSVNQQRMLESRNSRLLDNKTLQEKVNRLKLEQEFRKLTNENVKPIRSRIERMLTDVGIDVGKRTLTVVLNAAIQQALKQEGINARDFAKLVSKLLEAAGKKK